MTSKDTGHENLIAEYAATQAILITALARQTDIEKHLFRELGYGTHHIDGQTITIAPTTILNTKRFTITYPVLRYPYLYKPTPDTNAINQHLALTEIQKFQNAGEPRVTTGKVPGDTK